MSLNPKARLHGAKSCLFLGLLLTPLSCAGIAERLAHPTVANRAPARATARESGDNEEPPTTIGRRAEAPAPIPMHLPFGGWITVTSDHLALHTDANEGSARDTANQFEAIHASLARWFGLGVDATSPAGALEVVLFANPVDYLDLVGEDRGIFVSGAKSPDVLIAPLARDDDELNELLARGFAYQLTRAKYPHLPGWL
jgi:hypothetical protein